MARKNVELAANPQWDILKTPPAADLQRLAGRISRPLDLRWRPGTLTVAMIVKNEAANIRQAIASFRAIADEIVVNDTGSDDGTQAILEELGVTWFQGDWRGDFSYARNLALDQATSSWVIWLDADDRIPEDQVPNFLKLKTAPLDRAFGFQVINTQGGLPIGGRFMQLRMFPNHPHLRFRYRIHEQIMHSLVAMGLHLFYTETTLHHTGYENPELKRAKAQRNLDLLAQEPDRVRDEPSLGMSVGDSYFILGEWEKGIAAYMKVWEMPECRERHREVYSELPACIGRGYQYLGLKEKALPWFDKSMELQPNKVEAPFYKAECLMEMGLMGEALRVFLQVTRMPLSFSTTANQYDVIRMYAFYHSARLLADRGDVDEAMAQLTTMHAAYDQVVESWVLLGQCHLRKEDLAQARAAFEKALALNPKARPESHQGLLDVLRKSGLDAEYQHALRRAREIFPHHPFAAKAKAGLSICLIVKNEEKNLPACLDSVQGLADEIIVVDTGSQDGTVEAATRKGAKIFHHPWQNDFSLARNFSLDQATQEWILWLDADDRLKDGDRQAIRALVDAEARPPSQAFGFLVKNSGDGGLTGTVFNQVRLFPNRKELRFESPIHEQILPSLERAGVPVRFLPITVLHTGYADPVTAREKQKRNREMLEKQIRDGMHVTPITYYTLGNACLDLDDAVAAEKWFGQAYALAKSRGDNPHVIDQVPVKIAVAQAARGEPESAWKALQPALDPSRGQPLPEALLVKAQILAALGREEQACGAYVDLLKLREGPTFMPVDYALLKVKALQYLGSYWHSRGLGELGISLLRAGLAVAKGGDFGPGELEAAYKPFAIASPFS